MHIDLGKAKGILGGTAVILKGRCGHFLWSFFIVWVHHINFSFVRGWTSQALITPEHSHCSVWMCLFFRFFVFLRAALDGDNCKSKDHFFTPVSGLLQLCLTKEDVVSETALKYNSAFLNRSSSFSDECVGTSLWQCPKNCKGSENECPKKQ